MRLEEERIESLKNTPDLMRSAADNLDEEEIKSGWATGKKKAGIKLNRNEVKFEIDEDFFDIIKVNEQERREAIE